jgi:DNA-directed RNA polymerase specialized sigma24 family protein
VANQGAQRRAHAAARERARALSDAELVMAMRRDDAPAFVEFIERFRHVAWNHASALGVDAAERKGWVEELLHDCALALARQATAVPARLAGYVVVALRRKFFLDLRRASGDAQLAASYADDVPREAGERSGAIDPALARLVSALTKGLSPDDLLLLTWKSEMVGYTQIAAWLGVKRDTVAHRAARLATKLRQAAATLVEALDDEDRAAVERLLRRIDGGNHG